VVSPWCLLGVPWDPLTKEHQGTPGVFGSAVHRHAEYSEGTCGRTKATLQISWY
jgi:hypothetical protein